MCGLGLETWRAPTPQAPAAVHFASIEAVTVIVYAFSGSSTWGVVNQVIWAWSTEAYGYQTNQRREVIRTSRNSHAAEHQQIQDHGHLARCATFNNAHDRVAAAVLQGQLQPCSTLAVWRPLSVAL
jgi:hypothetical protein